MNLQRRHYRGTRFTLEQLEDRCLLSCTSIPDLPDTLNEADEFFLESPVAHGAITDSQSGLDLVIETVGDVEAVYITPQVSGRHVIEVFDFLNVVDPIAKLYDESGTCIAQDDNSGPTNTAARIRVNLRKWERYVLAIGDVGSDSMGDILVLIERPDSFTGQEIELDSRGDGLINGTLDDRHDTDSYHIVVPDSYSGNSAAIVVDPPAGVDVAAALWDGDGQLMEYRDHRGGGGAERFTTSSLTVGHTYFVTVLSSQMQPEGDFTVRVNLPTFATFDEVAFVGSRTSRLTDLFHSNGTDNSGSGLLNDIPSPILSPRELTVVGDQLFYAASGLFQEFELYKTTSRGLTRRVKTIGTRVIEGNPRELTAWRDRLYFVATTGDGQSELFVSDGTEAGTNRVRDLSGSRSSNPADLTVVGNRLYFTAVDRDGQRELHVTDGTSSGTRLVKNLYGNTVSSEPSDLTDVDGRLYFVATVPGGDRELHRSNGTANGTRLVKDIGGTVNSLPRTLTAFDGKLFFRARGADGQTELWKSDGTSAGTQMVSDLYGARSNSNPRHLTVFKNWLYFVATRPDGQAELHRSNGTRAELFTNLSGATSSSPLELTVFRNRLMFSAVGTDGQRELYSTRGTPSSTVRVADLSGPVSANPRKLTVAGTTLYFAAANENNQVELYRSNGVAAGTELVKNLPGNTDPHEIVPFEFDALERLYGVFAQQVEGRAFLRGRFVQVGVSNRGTVGATTPTPQGFTDPSRIGRDGNSDRIGIIVDSDKQGFSSFDGDFIAPGSAEEGFSVQIAGINYSNNSAAGLREIPGSISAVRSGRLAEVEWNGQTPNGMTIDKTFTVDETNLYLKMEVTLTNDSTGNMNDVYYMHNVNPDNDQTLHGSFATRNTIVGQAGGAGISIVTAEQSDTGPGASGGTEATGSAISLISLDPRSRVTHGGLENRNASDVYEARGNLEGTVGAIRNRDEAISIAFFAGSLTPNESTTFVYYYGLTSDPLDYDGILGNEILTMGNFDASMKVGPEETESPSTISDSSSQVATLAHEQANNGLIFRAVQPAQSSIAQSHYQMIDRVFQREDREDE